MAKVYKAYLDASFVTGDSPATLDVLTDLGRTATQGFFHNYGGGVLKIALSTDGTTYGDDILMNAGDVVGFGGGTRIAEAIVPIAAIKVTWVSDTAYKAFLN
jgi:hypothetical protein